MAKKQIKVCLDAGHYGKYNRSPVVPAYYESDMTWKLHLLQKEILEGYGCQVITTRDSQAVDRAVYDRGYAAEGCDLMISNHSNACNDEKVDYPVTYRAYDNQDNADELALALAQAVAEVMGTAQAGRTAIRKGTSGEYYAVLRGARAAGVSHYYLIEHGFHTNRRTAEWLQNDANLRRLAEAECKVIADYFGLLEDTETETPPAEQETAPKQESASEQETTQTWEVPYTIVTTCDDLNIRSGPGMTYPVKGAIREAAGAKKRYTIVEEQNGWGRLKSGAGWIALSKTSRGAESSSAFTPYTIVTTCDDLNIRSGPGMTYPVKGAIREAAGAKKRYTIVEEQNGWGRLKSGAGWIALSKTARSS